MVHHTFSHGVESFVFVAYQLLLFMQLLALFPPPPQNVDCRLQAFLSCFSFLYPWKKSILHPILGGKEQSYPIWTEKAITHFFSKTRILKKVYIERKKEIAGTVQSHDDTFDTPLKVGAFTLGVVKKTLMFVSSNCHANYIIYDLNLFLA